MAWHDIAPYGYEDELRSAFLETIRQAYDENCLRFAPDDVGDNNISFSHNVRENLRFLTQRTIEALTERHLSLAGAIEVFWKGLIYEVRLPGNFRIHIYKVPPGIQDVRKLRFNNSKRQVEILRVNADQLALKFDSALDADLTDGRLDAVGRQIVIVHFGDPIDGLDKVIVGEPFLSELDAPDWVWIEDMSDGTVLHEREPHYEEPVLSDEMADDDDFDDLRMREDADSEDATGTGEQ